MSMPPPSPVTMSAKNRWRRRLLRALRSILFIYFTVVVVFALFQRRLIFQGMNTQNSPEARIPTPPDGSELLHLQSVQGNTVAALFGPALTTASTRDPLAKTRPTLMYFYGNAMCMADALEQFHTFRQLGLNVMLVDYLGYGLSTGEASEAGCYEAAETAYQHLLTRTDIDTHLIIPSGWSLGGAVAIHLAASHASENHIAAVITFCTFTSMVDVANKHYPFLPASWLLQHRFNSLQKIPAIHVPIFLAHGQRDSIVPFPMSDRLAAAATAPVSRFIVPDADHNDFFEVTADTLPDAMKKFLATLTAADGNTK